MRVLLVDDEALVLHAMRAVLEGAGYEVVAAAGGAEAIERLRREAGGFELAVIDLSMPEVDGAAVLRAVRACAPGLPVVLGSGYAEEEVRERLADLEPEVFVHKPYTADQLLAALERARERGAGEGLARGDAQSR